MELDTLDVYYIAQFLGGFLFGFYSGVFALYLRHYASRKEANYAILFYALCVLYILSGTIMILDMLITVFEVFVPSYVMVDFRLNMIQPAIFGCCDFIAQSILIYRCWIVWNRNIRVVIIPIIMAFAFLAMWVVAGIAGNFIAPDGMIDSAAWGTHVTTTCIVVSMTLNALVTGLIVFKIFKVFQVSSTILDETSLGVPGGSTLRYVMFVIIESGMILFSIQLARVVTTALKAGGSKSDLEAFNLFVSSHEMLNGIIPTIILVRVSMGLSFHDETSLIEAAGSLRFATDYPETRRVNQENDAISSCDNADIQALERRSASETIDKAIELKDSCVHNQRDPVDSMVESP